MAFNELVRVDLPHLDPKRWKKLKDLYQRMENIKDSQTLVSILQEIYQVGGHSTKDFYNPQNEATGRTDTACNSKLPFSGFQIFLDSVLTDAEKRVFLQTTLPFIANLASKIDEYAPAEGFFVSCKQKPCCISLDRKFVASILASGFLCALSKNTATKATRNINFDHLYANFHRPELRDIQAAKLRCFLCYFERLAATRLDIPGEIIFERQVINKSSLPSIDDWINCDTQLSPLIVEHHKKIVDSEPSFLQVEFSNYFVGGGLLSNEFECGQQEILFCTSPELLVAAMFMELMEDNESLVIKGAERFSSLDSDGEHFVQFTGDYNDSTERDICGNLQKVVSSVALNQDCGQQNYEELVLRLLNKALVCFHGQYTTCELIKTKGIGITNGYEEEMEINNEDELGQETYEDSEDDVEEDEEEEESGIMYIEDDEMTDVNGYIPVEQVDKFCTSLVSLAYKEAQGEIKVKSRVPCIHSGDSRDMFENLMKKSVHEVFKMTPEKERKYAETIISSPLIPKCLLHSRDFSESDSPLVPGTPPSSPSKRSLVTSGNQSPVSFLSTSSTPLSDEVRLGTTSFADSLAESLMSCVMLSSSLATSIATIASTPLRITSVAMETLQESPVKKSHQILSSFLSPKTKVNNKAPLGLTNGDAEFGLIDVPAEADAGLELNPYVDETSEEDSEARRRSLTELALSFFEDFASKLAKSIIKSAKGYVTEDGVLDSIDEELEDHDDDSNNDSSSDSHPDNSNGNDSNEFQHDDEGDREEESRDSNNGGKYGNEANNKNQEAVNHDSQSTDSDSEHDSEGPWVGLDIDKEFEDRLYELDLTEDEETSNNIHPKCITEMADVVVNRLLSSAYPKAVQELEKAKFYDIEPIGEQNVCSEVESKNIDQDELDSENSLFYKEPFLALENGFSSERFIGYARDLSTNVIQEALMKASKKFQQENFYEKNIEICSEEEKKNLYFTEKLNEKDGPTEMDETENMRVKRKKELETGKVHSEMFESDSVTYQRSLSEEDLQKFADVLSIQLIETSVAIAGASVLLQDKFLSIRPIANWRCGAFGSNSELEAVIQWLAASVVGCPSLVYHTSEDARLEKFSKVQQTLRQRDCRVCDVINSILRYSKYVNQQDKGIGTKISSLFEMLLEECRPC